MVDGILESQIYRLGSDPQPFSAGRMSDDSVDFRLEEIFFRADYRFLQNGSRCIERIFRSSDNDEYDGDFFQKELITIL